MNTRRFVTGSSVVLAAWLGATFLHEVPAQRYPKLQKNAAIPKPVATAPEIIATTQR